MYKPLASHILTEPKNLSSGVLPYLLQSEKQVSPSGKPGSPGLFQVFPGPHTW